MKIFAKRMFAIIEDDDGKFRPHTFGGYSKLITPSEFESVLSDLVEYCANNTDTDIMILNEKLENNWFNGYVRSNTKIKEHDKNGYVYVLRCEDKYKIGYSQDVERRVKQLDTRPFPLRLVLKIYSEIAYDIEQELHKTLSEYKLTGEWYSSDITNIDIEALIKEIEENLICDTQS